MQNFPDCIAHVLVAEGGLVNDPQDPGGVTKFGISQRSYPALDIRELTPEAPRRASTGVYPHSHSRLAGAPVRSAMPSWRDSAASSWCGWCLAKPAPAEHRGHGPLHSTRPLNRCDGSGSMGSPYPNSRSRDWRQSAP
ncbi:MAG: hypothetical protein IT487_14145 [Chromatiaceae bacterium]|nr:hypothetical protein [Chromatiaceae bacterium]